MWGCGFSLPVGAPLGPAIKEVPQAWALTSASGGDPVILPLSGCP